MAIRNGIKEELKELNLRKITLEDMMDYIATEEPEEKEWFKKLWKGKLDNIVSNLQSKGIESTPYEDKKW